MKLKVSIFFIVGLLFNIEAFAYKAQKDTLLMGSAFQFTAIHHDSLLAQQAVSEAVDEVIRIESLISSWNPYSQTSEINRNAGIKAVKVDLELFRLIERSQKVSGLSEGVFDITFASIMQIWSFDGSQSQLPDSIQVLESVSLIGYENIILNEKDTTVFLKYKGMQIGFGAIGKGYAADQAINLMKSLGVSNALVNAGGDLKAIGQDVKGKAWKIGIADPKDKSKILSWISIQDQAIITSGNYEKYIEIDGVKYSHIIHPKTGWPVHGLQSVTVICASAEAADALATTVFILGKDKGLEFINYLDNIECFLVTDSGELFSSKNLKLNYYK